MIKHSAWFILSAVLSAMFLFGAADSKDSAKRTPDSKDKDYGAELPRIPARTPAEALRSFEARTGFHVELVAAEPLVMSPVALDIDENGRMFVAEYPEYNAYANKKPHGRGRIAMLEDTDGDGRFDRRTVYADNVDLAVAVACWDGGVYVGAPPHLLYLKDTRGHGKADVRRVVYTGFGTDLGGEGMLNSFRWGLDNRFHISTNLDGGNVRPGSKSDAKPVSVRGYGFLLDPRGEAFELTGGGGQHGMSLDDWGRTYVCGNSDPYSLVMYDSRYLSRNPYLQAPPAAVNIAPAGKYTKLHRISPVEPWRALRTRLRSQRIVPGSDEGGSPSGFFTGGTGVTVYRGDAYPAEYRGNLFVGDVANNVVHRARVEPQGVTVTALPAEKDREFLASTDNWFRPVQFVNAPDGCLWVIDMYRELIEGAAFLPPQILKHMDVGSGVDRGRIYRIAPDGFKGRKTPKLGKTASAELVRLLEHPDAWHRETAARLLYQRQDESAVEPLKDLVAKSTHPVARVQALYSLAGLKSLSKALVLNGLSDAEPHVREHSLRLAERFVAAQDIWKRMSEMSDDTVALVRCQLANSLGAIAGAAPAPILAKLARRDGADPWIVLAILSSSSNCAGDLFRLLASDTSFRATANGRKLLATLAAQIGAANRSDDIAAVVKPLAALSETDKGLARELVIQLVSKQPGLGKKLVGLDSGQVAAILTDVLTVARKTATDERKPPAERVAAVRSLALASFADVGPLLTDLLPSRQPPEVQSAAIETLSRFPDLGVATTLLSAWRGFSPKVRATAAETLFARPVWIHAFLDAVAKGQVARADVEPARLELLKTYPDPGVKARAAKLFAGAGLLRRNDVVAAYAKALQIKGDAARGKAVFKSHCSACHQLEGVGNNVGADLKAIRDQGLEAVMLNILDPNREVKPQYLTYVVETKNGRVVTGMIMAETANNLTIRRADGVEEAILRLQIEELRSTGLSFMPEGLEKQIDVPAMADLLAYLNSVK